MDFSHPHRKWTKEDCDLLAKLWKDGADVSFIAQSFGVTRNAVLGIRHRLKLQRRRKPTKGPEYEIIKQRTYWRYK